MEEKNEQLETHTATERRRRRRDGGSGKETGRGHGEKWGKPMNRESLRDQPGLKINMIRRKTQNWRQTDGRGISRREYESGGNKQMEASERRRG